MTTHTFLQSKHISAVEEPGEEEIVVIPEESEEGDDSGVPPTESAVSFDEFIEALNNEPYDATELIEAIGIAASIQDKTNTLANLKDLSVKESNLVLESILSKGELYYVLSYSDVSLEAFVDTSADIISKAIVALANLFVTVLKSIMRLFVDYLANFFSAATKIRNASEDLLKRVNRLSGTPQHLTLLLDNKHYPVIDVDGELDIDIFTVGIEEQIAELKSIVTKERIKDKKTNKARIKGILGGDQDYVGKRTDAWGLTMIKDSAYRLTKDSADILEFKKYTLPYLESKAKDLEYSIRNSGAETEQVARDEYAEAQREINTTVSVIKDSLRSFVKQNQARLSVIAMMAANIK